MGHAAIVARAIRRLSASPSPRRIVEIGAGDGAFMLSVARRLARGGARVDVVLVDRQNIFPAEATQPFRALDWHVEVVQADVLDWLARAGENPADVMIANLFLHHFREPQLKELLALAERRTDHFIACEPRRSHAALAASRLLGFIGCNGVTRHDGVISVRAGFRGHELSVLWPKRNGWHLHEGTAGFFSHCFVAACEARPH
jgi:NAD(P)-dependent dehydrogenase (short-subunit alcohol dehydrogenase family)